MRISRAVAVLLASTGIIAASLAAGTAASAAPERSRSAPAIVAAQQDYWWEWSDGSTATNRTFTQARYGVQGNLPHLVVHAEPAYPSHVVLLQFYQHGRWQLENSKRTNGNGIATIDLDPFCSNNTWCDGTFKYRLKVAGQTSSLRITYSET